MVSKKTSWGGGVLYNKSITNKIALVITFIGLLVLISGTSYAILKGNIYSDEEQVIKAGSVTLKLTENFENIDKKIMIMEDSEGLLQETTYDFNIKNIGDTTARYDVKLVNEIPSNYAGEVLSIEYIKVGLEINEEEYGPMNLDELNGLIDSGIIYKKEIINYKLRIWLDSDKKNEIEELSDYKAFLKIKVEVEQRPDSFDENEAVVFNYTGEEQKYVVPRDGWYYIELGGAQGGSSICNDALCTQGGLGAKTSGYIDLKAGEKLYFHVGGKGEDGKISGTAAGGYNGGGSGTWDGSDNEAGGGGGGATDVRIFDDEAPPTGFRYVRDYLSGSDENSYSHWVEIKVYDKSNILISNNKKFVCSHSCNYHGTAVSSLAYSLTDGDITSANYIGQGGPNRYIETYVEIDLGKEYEIGKVEVWHYYGDGRTYHNNKTMLLNNDKSKSVIIFDGSESGNYAETSVGRSTLNNSEINSLIGRIMVAGGGGGASWNYTAGNGGTLYGSYGNNLSSQPGTQISGYQFGRGENAYGTGSSDGVGGAGGGYYGGYASSVGGNSSSPGGSSYISGYGGVNSITKNTSITHTNQTLHYSGKYFIGARMIEGQHSGNGYAKILYVDEKPKRKNTKLNNVRYIKDCSTGNTRNGYGNWTDIQAIVDGVNIAKGKKVTGTVDAGSNNPYTYVVDGLINTDGTTGSSTSTTPQCVTVDLGNTYDVDEISILNFFGSLRNYYNNITYVSSDNSNWVKVINEEAIQNPNGKRINAYTDTINGYVQDNLVLWYDGYANTGNTHDTSSTTWKNLASSLYTGSLNQGTWKHNCLSLDGDYDWVGIAEMNYDTPTVEVVVSLSALPVSGYYGVVNNFNSGGYGIEFHPDGYKSSYFINGTYHGFYFNVLNPVNKISSISTNYDKNYIKLFTNGVLDIKQMQTGSIGYPTQSTIMALGTNPWANTTEGSFFNGNIYSVRVYDRALTDEEVMHNYLVDKQKYNLE